jgi:hypothetical protein
MALAHGHISNTKNALAYYDTIGVTEEMIINKVHKEMLFLLL